MASTRLSLIHSLFGSSFGISRWYIPGHDGIDLPAKYGTPVYAIQGGRVSYARDSRLDPNAKSAWAAFGGNVVNIDIDSRYTTQYAHLSKIVVQSGTTVHKGQLIGYVGDTGGGQGGSSSGTWLIPGAHFGTSHSHVHFGLWDHKAGKMIEPTRYLTAVASGGAVVPDTSGPVLGPPTTAPLGAWADTVKFPTGHVITQADIDNVIMPALLKAGYFNDPVSGKIAYDVTHTTLENVALGHPWNKDLQVQIQAALNQDATNAGQAGGLAAFADIAGKLTDPGNWIRILALATGAILVGVGGYGILRATGEGSGA